MNIYVETNFLLELAFVQNSMEAVKELLPFPNLGKQSFFFPPFALPNHTRN